MTATRLFLRWGAFDKVPLQGGGVSYEDLAKMLGVDANVMRRVGGMLVASRILCQVGDDNLAHSLQSLTYVNSGKCSILARMFFDETLKSCAFLPEYFDQYREEPQGPIGCPYSFAHGQPEESLWDIMNRDPERMRVFMRAMETIEALMPATVSYEFGWVKEERAKNPGRMLLVDVGGGQGHVVEKILQENQWLPRDRCVLQDREEVIREVNMSDNAGLRGVNKMTHDFNMEQPVKDALVYHIRRCLHNYGDEMCVQILCHISDAMAPDSRLLIVEQVIETPPTSIEAYFDLVMMTVGGKERNTRQFEDLVRRAGLVISEIHKVANSPISMVECVKA